MVIFILSFFHSFIVFSSAQRMDNVLEHSKYIQAVDEYRPAPGQYVNDIPEYEEGDTEATMVQKCTEMIAGDYQNTHLIALGGWGGYVTFHFDHSIANIPDQRDFAVWGNAYQEQTNQVFGGMNEAGIVMVSKDVNGNGLPDDPWYEISGSCDVDSIGKVIYNYEVTYQRNPMGNIPWIDNQGHSGTIDRVNQWHPQEYYPEWLPDGLTFRGTRLPDNMLDLSETVERTWSQWYYVLVGFRYGYVDNLANWTDKADANSWNYEGCGIDISWAVDENRQPVNLDFIDFVRVYTGLNQKCPAPNWWGETSTEIQCAEDLHLDASLDAIRQATAIKANDNGQLIMDNYIYNLLGHKISPKQKGIYIQNGKKIIIQ
ncbi:MAG: hypothetical protein J6Q22_11440 [Prevotella sp.]|nr:hypothetical protein [Prevotella sp.]